MAHACRVAAFQSLDFIDYPRRGVSVRESPDLLISRNTLDARWHN